MLCSSLSRQVPTSKKSAAEVFEAVWAQVNYSPKGARLRCAVCALHSSGGLRHILTKSGPAGVASTVSARCSSDSFCAGDTPQESGASALSICVHDVGPVLSSGICRGNRRGRAESHPSMYACLLRLLSASLERVRLRDLLKRFRVRTCYGFQAFSRYGDPHPSI